MRKNWFLEEQINELGDIKRTLLSRGEDLIDLSMINPDLKPPQIGIEKLTEAVIKQTSHRYAVSRGIRKLRDAFSQRYKRIFGVSFDSDSEVCATGGTKDALLLSISTFVKSEGKVLIGTPTYPVYRSAIAMSGLEPVFFSIQKNEDRMLQEISQVLIDHNISFIILNFPNNPTGITVTESFYFKLFSVCEKHDVFVFNDFVYGEMVYDRPSAYSLFSCENFKKRGIESYSLSKAFSVPGWRSGALVGEKNLIKKISLLKSRLDYGTFLPVQLASASLLGTDIEIVQNIREIYLSRANSLVTGLNKMGWSAFKPKAGVSIWVKVPEEFRDGYSFAKKALKEAYVACLPGSFFGEKYQAFVRFALVVSEDRLSEVVRRLSSIDKV